ncbi:hypothetical protein [Cerasicoccus frondis]|uniref:hypothetical protein n=1 Tax=Cerasicoccus frondis TaxID=490090 RepID=UPI0028524E65|nr:hypothetical protein [Cerasicoccus frondis]
MIGCTIPLPDGSDRQFIVIGLGYVRLDEPREDGVVQGTSQAIGVNIVNSEVQSVAVGISQARVAITPLGEEGIILEHSHDKLEIYKPADNNEGNEP